jgi:hypothetical protein
MVEESLFAGSGLSHTIGRSESRKRRDIISNDIVASEFTGL